MLFALEYLLNNPRNIWTTDQEMVNSDPSLEWFFRPLIIFFSKRVDEETQQSTGVKGQFTWFLDTLDVIQS